MRAARVDNTHGEVIKALRAFGWMVLDTHRLPGFVDAVAYKRFSGVQLIEIKKNKKAPLTDGQKKMIAAGWPVVLLWDSASVEVFNEMNSL